MSLYSAIQRSNHLLSKFYHCSNQKTEEQIRSELAEVFLKFSVATSIDSLSDVINQMQKASENAKHQLYILRLKNSRTELITILTKADFFVEWSSKPILSSESEARISQQKAKITELQKYRQDVRSRDREYQDACYMLKRMILSEEDDAERKWISSAPQEVKDITDALWNACNHLEHITNETNS
jgi:hypothetical protein